MKFLINALGVNQWAAFKVCQELLKAVDLLLDDDTCIVLCSSELQAVFHGSLRKTKLEVLNPGSGLYQYYNFNFPICRYIKSLRPDAVLFKQLAPINFHIPYVLRLTDSHLVDPAGEYLKKFRTIQEEVLFNIKKHAFWHSLKYAKAVLCTTQVVADMLLQRRPDLDPKKVFMQHEGNFFKDVKTITYPRKISKRLLTMHIPAHKNIELILQALALPELKEWTLTVMADLSKPRTKYEHFLAKLIGDLHLENRINSIGYVSKKDDLLKHLREHDIFICASTIESWSHTVVESMAIGIPVIASNIPCHREVTDGAAWLVPCRDPHFLAETILKISRGGGDIQERINRGFMVVKRYSWQKYASTILELLRDATKK